MQRVDYDRIAHLYDEPLRAHRLDPDLLRFLDERSDLPPDRARILDVGCGTGTQLAADRARFPVTRAVGLDLFGGMLAIARRRCPTVGWVRGDAARMPFRSESFDYVTNQFSYAHILDKAAFVREVARVLAGRGRFVLTNIDPWEMPNWILYRFFPAARALDDADFLPADALVALMSAAGLRDIRVARQRHQTRESVSAYLAYARERHRASQFLAISDVEYEAGIRRLEQAVAEEPDPSATIDSQLCLLSVAGNKP